MVTAIEKTFYATYAKKTYLNKPTMLSNLIEKKLPFSGITVKIGMSLFDRMEIEIHKNRLASIYVKIYDSQGKLKKEFKDGVEDLINIHEIKKEYAKTLLTRCVKSWDSDLELIWENLQNIEEEDYLVISEIIEDKYKRSTTKIDTDENGNTDQKKSKNL